MWLFNTLIITLIFLILIVIVSTSMKLGLIITNKHNYDSKLLIIPSILTVALWTIALFIFYLLFKGTFSNSMEDMILTLIMTPSSIENKTLLIVSGVVIVFVVILLQSFTYYAINIDYERIIGFARFNLKQKLNIKPKENKTGNSILINEEKFDVPFHIALITSILTSIISILLIFLLYGLGVKISRKIIP